MIRQQKVWASSNVFYLRLKERVYFLMHTLEHRAGPIKTKQTFQISARP
jgi:hypothetical protein